MRDTEPGADHFGTVASSPHPASMLLGCAAHVEQDDDGQGDQHGRPCENASHDSNFKDQCRGCRNGISLRPDYINTPVTVPRVLWHISEQSKSPPVWGAVGSSCGPVVSPPTLQHVQLHAGSDVQPGHLRPPFMPVGVAGVHHGPFASFLTRLQPCNPFGFTSGNPPLMSAGGVLCLTHLTSLN